VAVAVLFLLGLYFTALQAYEYFEAPYTFTFTFTTADLAYGSTFFCSNRISRTTRNYWNNITEAATAVVELLMMGVRTPETC
jgi:hypothetical protein